MRRKRLSLSVVSIIIVALFVTGCLGGAAIDSQDQTVHAFINEVTTAFGDLDANKIANLFEFPVLLELDEDETLELTQREFVQKANGFFTILKDSGLELTLRIEGSSGEVTIIEDGDMAILEDVTIYYKVKITEAQFKDLLQLFIDEIVVLIKSEGWADAILEAIEDEDFSEFEREMIQDLLDDAGAENYIDQIWEVLQEELFETWPGIWEEYLPLDDGQIPLKKIGNKWKFDLDY